MRKTNKVNKRNGIVGTFLFHSFLILSFFFLGLKYQDPPPNEEGISINFGFMEDGMGNSEDQIQKEKKQVIKETEKIKQVENTTKNITQTTSETINIKEGNKEEKTKKEIEEDVDKEIEEKKPEINKKALYTGKKKKSEGKKKQQGNQGNIEGEKNSKIYNSEGIGIDGSNYQLGGRVAINKVKPKNFQNEGTVVVIITVDRNGNVINAIAGAKGSTTLNKQLLNKAKNAALKTKFSAKESAPNNQQGRIIYYFGLN